MVKTLIFRLCLCYSISHGASWWNWREGSTKSQSLHHYSERGPRDYTSRGKESSCCMLSIVLHNTTPTSLTSKSYKWSAATCLSFLTLWSDKAAVSEMVHYLRQCILVLKTVDLFIVVGLLWFIDSLLSQQLQCGIRGDVVWVQCWRQKCVTCASHLFHRKWRLFLRVKTVQKC